MPGASTKGPFVVVDEGKRATFRDRDGWPLHELPAQALKNGKAPAEAPGPDGLAYTQEVAIASPDQSHVVLAGPLRKAAKAAGGPEDREPVGWEFRYHDFSGLLWKKRITEPYRYFYTHDDDSDLISEDGSRVVVLEVGTENDEEPYLWVYGKSGKVVLEEKVDLGVIRYFRLSANGRYLLFSGPKGYMDALLVIDVDHPQQRWLEFYDGSKTGPHLIETNAAGGFEVTMSDDTRYSFPH